MEEKKLNLDAPFRSVRRLSTKLEDTNKSEITKKKTPTRVMEASLVPFQWEQTPGKPKDHMVTTLTEESFRVEEKKKKKKVIALQRVSMAINQDLNIDDDYDYIHSHVYSNVSKKALFGLCSKNSLDVLNPVLSRVKTCQNLDVLNPIVSRVTTCQNIGILRSNRPVMSKSREHYQTPRFSKDISIISLSKSGEVIRIPRDHSRLQRTTLTDKIQRQGTRFLAEEVKRRRDINKIRSGTSQNFVTQPPLPRTPSESWLGRALPRNSAASVISKMNQKTNPQSIKWETIVKTSYKHNDHGRYSQELIVVHPPRNIPQKS